MTDYVVNTDGALLAALEQASEGDTITAVALVVLFGTLMIPLVPLLAKNCRISCPVEKPEPIQ